MQLTSLTSRITGQENPLVSQSRRKFLRTAIKLSVKMTTTALVGGHLFRGLSRAQDLDPSKVGVLHSLTGTMAVSGHSLVDSIMMAIAEINQRGGVLGRPLLPIVEDGASNVSTFIREAAQGLIFEALGGLVRIDPANQHTWKVARGGQIQADGQLAIRWISKKPIKPEPFSSILGLNA